MREDNGMLSSIATLTYAEWDFDQVSSFKKETKFSTLAEKYEWNTIVLTLEEIVKFWTPAAFQVEWFKIWYPVVEPAIIHKEFSPGRFRYFNLPYAPFMTAEVNKNDYVFVSVKDVHHSRNDIFQKVASLGVEHFIIQKRNSEHLMNLECEFKIPKLIQNKDKSKEEQKLPDKCGNLFVFSQKLKYTFQYSFEWLKIKIGNSPTYENLIVSFKDMLEIKDILHFEVKGLREVQWDMSMHNDIMQFRNKAEEQKEDFIFIDSHNKFQATLTNLLGRLHH